MRALERHQGAVLDGGRRHDARTTTRRSSGRSTRSAAWARARRYRSSACRSRRTPTTSRRSTARDDRILFTSDRPRNGDAHLYPQLDEYESTPTVTGTLVDGGRRHRPAAPRPRRSGDFTPLVASDGRVIFTRWDHLQRDQQNDEGTLDVRRLQLRLRDQHPGAGHQRRDLPRAAPSAVRQLLRTATPSTSSSPGR